MWCECLRFQGSCTLEVCTSHLSSHNIPSKSAQAHIGTRYARAHTQVSGFGYTPEYAPPEILDHGTQCAGKQADLWSFGVLLLEMIAGTLPEVGVSASVGPTYLGGTVSLIVSSTTASVVGSSSRGLAASWPP